MKNLKFVFVMAMMLAMAWPLSARDDSKEAVKEAKEAQKEYRKRMQAAKDSIDYYHSSRAVDNRHFVMQADQLMFSRGGSVSVVPSTNFVLVNGDKGMVQVSPRIGGGPNGVGGITVDGNISSYKVKTDKKGNRTITFTLSGNGLSTEVAISLYAKGNNASARVNPTFRGDAVSLNGNLYPYNMDRVTTGTPLM